MRFHAELHLPNARQQNEALHSRNISVILLGVSGQTATKREELTRVGDTSLHNNNSYCRSDCVIDDLLW